MNRSTNGIAMALFLVGLFALSGCVPPVVAAAETTFPRLPSDTVNFWGFGAVHPSGAEILTVPVSADARHRGEARRPAVGARTTGANEAASIIVPI